MLNLKPVLLVIGTLLSLLAVAMVIPAAADLFAGNQEWVSFFISAFLCAFVGITIVLTNQGEFKNINLRQAFILTTGTWIMVAVFGALPFWFSSLNLSYTDSFFEAMSGFTTTGSTILTGLDVLPPGILLWRSILQWLGGISMIIVVISVLPMLKIGGMQLFRTESTDKSDRVLPRTAQVSIAVGSVYMLLTVIYAIALWYAGMSGFDAVNHAMSIIATGGFSTHDLSIAHFKNPLIEYLITIFLVTSCFPLVLYVRMLRGELMVLFKDEQVKGLLLIMFISVAAIAISLIWRNGFDIELAIRLAAFNVISIISTTGYTSTDYSIWGGFAVTTIFMFSVIGGCAGSAAGGVKIFRYQILYQMTKAQISQLIQPHAVIRSKFNNKTISEEVSWSVIVFIILFAFCFLSVALILSLCGFGYMPSMTAAASALANVGPALDVRIGTSDNYAGIPDVAKWVLAFAMLVGRLELFTVLILLTPSFWRD
jgi:trk system potassium uptake protein TrkH